MIPGIVAAAFVATAPVDEPPVTQLTYKTAEALTETSNSGTSYTDLLSLTLDESEQYPSSDYLILWGLDITTNSTTNGARAKVLAGSTDQNPSTTILIDTADTGSPQDRSVIGGFFRFQTTASPVAETFKIQHANQGASSTKSKNMRLCALLLGADDEYAENISTQTFTDTTANKTGQTVLSLSFTPPSAGDYYVIASLIVDHATQSNCTVGVQLSDGTTTSPEFTWTNQGGATDRQPMMVMFKLTGISGSKTVTLKVRQAGTGTSVISAHDCRMVAIRADRFSDVRYVAQSGDTGTTSTTYVDKTTQTFTPTAADYLTIACWSVSRVVGGASAYCALDDDGTVVAESIRLPSVSARPWPGQASRIASFAAASRTQKFTIKDESGASTTTLKDGSAILSLCLDGLA